MRLEIRYEDEYLRVAVKPAGISSQSDKTNDRDMLTEVKHYLFNKNGGNGEPYAALINRLDKPVGGLVLFAKDEKTAALLTDMVKEHKIEKYYQAIVTGEVPEEVGTLKNYMVHDPKTNVSKLTDKDAPGAKEAELDYELIDEFETDEGVLGLLLIKLKTGRHHQIRCQLAGINCGIYGDVKYNKKAKARKGMKDIGLYASRLEFDHPVTGEHVRVKREPEGSAWRAIDLDEE